MSGTNDRYLLAEKAGTEGVWDWDLRADTLFLSPRFKAFLNLGADDALSRSDDWLSRVHPDDLPWLNASFEEQVQGLTIPFQIEHRVRCGGCDGGWRWLDCRGVAVNDEAGRPIRLVGSVADVTERKLAERRLRQSEERYALAATASNDGIFDWDLVSDTVYYSPRWKSLLGYADPEIADSPEEWLGRVTPADRAGLRATIDAIRTAGTDTHFQVEYGIRDAHGGQRWMNCRGVVVRGRGGTALRLVGSQADVTEHRIAERRLRQSEERYALASRGANDGLWDWMIDQGEAYFSPRWKDMLGYADPEIGNGIEEWFKRVVPGDVAGLEGAIEMHLSGDRDSLEHEFRMTHASGCEIWVLVRGIAVRDEDGRATRMAGSMTDITERKSAERQILFDAFHDALTGLPNRTLLLDRVGQALDRDRRQGRRNFAVLLIDLDRFKSINDTEGTDTGDLVLKIMAERLEETRRAGDTLARLSADEFCILLNGVDDAADALVAAERLGEAVAMPLTIAHRDVVLTASIGIAHSATGYDRPEEMLRDASLAMYRAKQGGRSRADVFDSNLRRSALLQMRTEADLRAAIEQDQLCLYYQPIIALLSGKIAGFEALMRWRHPERGLVSPAEFIPLAEESGLIVPMGRWALREATRQLAIWQERFPQPKPLFMSVNVSSRQFRDDDLLSVIGEVLADNPIPPSSLKLEITESLLMQDPKRCTELMHRIRDMDVRLSIDDFGTGYSSLSYLHQLPADTLKIDRSFVMAISTGESSAAIVQVITTLAAILNMDVVAEGVETQVEADFLRDIVCTYGQGYLYARPAPAADIEALLVQEFPQPRRAAAAS